MAQEDRDWFRQERKRRDQLIWNEKRSEIELEEPPQRRRKFSPPIWLRESFRYLGYVAATLVAAWILLFLVVPILAG